MSHEFMSVDTTGADATPGIMTANGSNFSAVGFFPVATGFGKENSAAPVSDWFPYDRMRQVPHPNSPADEGYGVYLWNRDEILLRENPGPAWVSKHTCANMDSTNGFAHHTGLYDLIGSDGRLYLVGMYIGDAANTMGYVIFDVAANTYTSGTNGTLQARPTRMGWATVYEGKLYCASEGSLYILDPAVPGASKVATLAIPTSDKRDKLFVAGTKLYLLGAVSGNFNLYELFGATMIFHATLGLFGLGPDGEWALHRDQNSVYVHWWSSGMQTRAIRPVDSTLLGAVNVTSHNVAGPFGGRSGEAGEPTGAFSSDDRYFAVCEVDQSPGLDTTGNLIYRQVAAGGYAAAWDAYSWAGTATVWTLVNPGITGGRSYFGAGIGNGPDLLNSGAVANTEKVVVYQSDRDANDRQVIKFWAFSNAPGPLTNLSVQVLTKSRSPDNRTRLPREEGTIFAVNSGGTLNGAQNRMDDVLQDQSGGGTHELVWDRPTDAIPVDQPDDGVYATLFMFQA